MNFWRPNPGSSLSQNTVSFSTFSASTVRREIIFFPNRAMSPVPVSSMGRSSPAQIGRARVNPSETGVSRYIVTARKIVSLGVV